jgi:hypothetical protein
MDKDCGEARVPALFGVVRSSPGLGSDLRARRELLDSIVSPSSAIVLLRLFSQV